MSFASMSHVALTEKSAPLVEKAKTAKDAMSEKWKGFDERNQVSESTLAVAAKTKEVVTEGLSKMTSFDETYQMSHKLQSGVTSGFMALSNMVKRASSTGGAAAAAGNVDSAGMGSGNTVDS